MMDFFSLAHQCAPTVSANVVVAIMRTESHFDPLALHLNGSVRLRSPPATAAQAAQWSDWMIRRGYSVDMGLMQINSRNLAMLRMSTLDAFNPCKNIQAGAAILTANYHLAAQSYGPGGRTLLRALSAYNTGNFENGFRNGYVNRVVMNASAGDSARLRNVACPSGLCTAGVGHQIRPNRPEEAGTAVEGFAALPRRSPPAPSDPRHPPSANR
jgi:type IV secretion system protein VirB1